MVRTDGALVGRPVGRLVGKPVGIGVGDGDGLALGCLVGSAVGNGDGKRLGRPVGNGVGALVVATGDAVGSPVGTGDGAGDGGWDGLNEQWSGHSAATSSENVQSRNWQKPGASSGSAPSLEPPEPSSAPNSGVGAAVIGIWVGAGEDERAEGVSDGDALCGISTVVDDVVRGGVDAWPRVTAM